MLSFAILNFYLLQELIEDSNINQLVNSLLIWKELHTCLWKQQTTDVTMYIHIIHCSKFNFELGLVQSSSLYVFHRWHLVRSGYISDCPNYVGIRDGGFLTFSHQGSGKRLSTWEGTGQWLRTKTRHKNIIVPRNPYFKLNSSTVYSH